MGWGVWVERLEGFNFQAVASGALDSVWRGDAGFGGLGVKAAVGWYILPLGSSLDLMAEACQGTTATNFTVQRLARPYAIDSKPQDLQRQAVGGSHTRSEEALSPYLRAPKHTQPKALAMSPGLWKLKACSPMPSLWCPDAVCKGGVASFAFALGLRAAGRGV